MVFDSLQKDPKDRMLSKDLLMSKWILDHKQNSIGRWMYDKYIPLKKNIIKEYKRKSADF